MTVTAVDTNTNDPFAQVKAKIVEMGPVFNESILMQTRDLYRPFLQAASTEGVTVQADVAYGSDPRHKLDIYRGAGQRLPVLLFVPGGGFVGGDKNSDGVFYGNVGMYFAKHGYLAVVANYRLAPVAPWPAGSEDVASAVAWARANAARHGGDPRRLIVFGQSAGSSHVAGFLFNPQFNPEGVAAAILMSAPYKFSAPLLPNIVAYVGADESAYPARSPLTHVASSSSKIPLMLSAAEYDPVFLSEPTYELAAAVTRRDGKSPYVAFMAGHNHVSTVQSLGSGQDDSGEKIRAFLARF